MMRKIRKYHDFLKRSSANKKLFQIQELNLQFDQPD